MRIPLKLSLPRGNPTRRLAAALSALMLGVGIAVGAALGPAPDASLAGGDLAAHLPALIAGLAAPTATGGPPPLLRSFVQPPCPEGVAAGAACAPETPGQLTAADEFLKTTLAQITATPGFRERGLVVVTFTSVGLAAQQGLP